MRKSKSIPLPMDIIREALELDPASPTWLRWRVRPRHHFNSDRGWRIFNTRDAGRVAGNKQTGGNGNEYYRIGIGGKSYQVHRVVFAVAHGVDPGDQSIDHISGDTLNNSPANLRLATHAENLRNRGTPRTNTSGRKGVSWDKRKQKWLAQIKINGRGKFLGYFHNINEASSAYERAARNYFGEFHREEKTK